MSTRNAAADVWSLGNYDAIAPFLQPVAATTVAAVGARRGERVLDVAAGTGNAAIEAARRGARVTALDLTDALRERGERRTAAAGLDVRWVAGDVVALPFPDDAFDVAVSVLGVMFASDPRRAASELLRVVTHGGRIAVANWTRHGLSGELSRCLTHHAGSPPRTADPHDWGDPARLGDWLGPGATDLRAEQRVVTWRLASPEAAVSLLEDHAAAFVAVRRHIGESRWAAARADMLALFERAGRTAGDGFELDWAYLLAIAHVSG